MIIDYVKSVYRIEDSQLTMPRLAVLAYLASLTENAAGDIKAVGIAKIAQRVHGSERTVKRILPWLEEHGYLLPNGRTQDKSHLQCYRLNVKKLPPPQGRDFLETPKKPDAKPTPPPELPPTNGAQPRNAIPVGAPPTSPSSTPPRETWRERQARVRRERLVVYTPSEKDEGESFDQLVERQRREQEHAEEGFSSEN